MPSGRSRHEQASAAQGYALIWTLYLTGARWGEATGLRVQDLDFLRRRIRIAQVNTRQGIKGYPKGRRNRTVPMPAQLADVLADHLSIAHSRRRDAAAVSPTDQRHGLGSVPQCPGERVNDQRLDRSALVFANANGGPISDANFRHRIWKPAVEAAGLAHLNPRIHDLRHSLASRLIQQGVPDADIAAQLGHSSVLVTRRYTHLGENRHDKVLAVLDTPTRLRRASDS